MPSGSSTFQAQHTLALNGSMAITEGTTADEHSTAASLAQKVPRLVGLRAE